jgi:hypothetical protein
MSRCADVGARFMVLTSQQVKVSLKFPMNGRGDRAAGTVACGEPVGAPGAGALLRGGFCRVDPARAGLGKQKSPATRIGRKEGLMLRIIRSPRAGSREPAEAAWYSAVEPGRRMGLGKLVWRRFRFRRLTRLHAHHPAPRFRRVERSRDTERAAQPMSLRPAAGGRPR